MGVTKSPYDSKEYRTIRLENGIVVLLISDQRVHPGSHGHVRRGKGRRRRTSSEAVEEEVDGKGGESSDSDSQGTESDYEDSEDECSGSEVDGPSKATDPEEMLNPIQSACAVCVKVGSFSDPDDIPGLAHLLEHMVFMGSEKYPGENTFDVFTTRHGGYDNASTDYETTVFEFCIHQPYFREALDMFAHFFASPQLLKGSLDREIEAVDSEFQSSIQSDTDRMQQLLCSFAKKDHPFAKFVWGNSESLKKGLKRKGINLAKRLKQFHKRMYSSHYMTAAVISPDPLDNLEVWARDSFSAVPHNQQPLPTFTNAPPAFEERSFHRLYKVVPVKDTHEIQVTWQLPCLFDKYRVKPLHYLGWLLGHEGEGSALSHLKKRNLATSICAGNSGLGYEYNSCFSLFKCTLTLSDKGFEQIFECLTVIFQYLKLLRVKGPQERIFKEIQTIEENEFNFKEEEEPIDYVEKLCESMQYYPEEDFLTGDDLLFEYDPEVINLVQAQLVPEKANIMLLSKKFADGCTEKEKWFGTQHSVEEIPAEWERAWQSLELNLDLHLPAPNIFIATDFSLKEPDIPTSKYPVLIEECDKYKVWFRKDNLFSTPRAWVCVLFQSPVHNQSPEHTVLIDIFLNLLSLNMSEVAYAADVAQLEYSTNVVTYGLALTINGLNHKLLLLFDCIVKQIASFSTTEENFKMAKEQLKRNYHNYILKPKKLNKISRLKLLDYQYWSTVDKLAVVDSLHLASLTEFVTKFKKQLFVEMLVQGNMTAQDAKDLMTQLCNQLEFTPLPKLFRVQPRAVQLPSNTQICCHIMNRDQQSPNTVIMDYYQCSPRTTHDAAMSSLITKCMAEPCFDILRTKQQLGYEVDAMHHNTHGVLGLSLSLVTQGSKHSVEYASSCMDGFVREFRSTMSSWSEDEFQAEVESLIQEILEPDHSLEEEVSRNWGEILTQRYQFDRLEKEVEQLRTITQEEAGMWLQEYTHPGEHYRKLSMKVVSHNTGAVTKESTDTPDGEVEGEADGEEKAKLESSVDPPLTPVAQLDINDSELESFKRTLHIYPSYTANS